MSESSACQNYHIPKVQHAKSATFQKCYLPTVQHAERPTCKKRSPNNFPSERVSNPLPIAALGSWVSVLLHCIAEHAVCALISSPLVANVHFPVHDDGLYAYSPSSQHRYLLSPAIQEFTTMFGISHTMPQIYPK